MCMKEMPVPHVKTESVEMYYEEFGTGTPLVLVSGTGWSGEHWKLEQVPFFSPSYRVIVFDHRGCGRSDKPKGPYTTRMFADDAVELLDALGIVEPVHLLGHSMGGRIAQWMALDHPGRVRSLVLAASGPGPIDDRPSVPGISPELVAEFLALGWPGYNEEHLRGSNMFFRAAPEVIERFVGTHRGQFGTDVVSYLRHVDARQRHNTRERLADIATPTLVIVGAEDNYGSPGHLDTCRYMAAQIPGAEFVLIDAVAHALHIETAAQFNGAVAEFLGRH